MKREGLRIIEKKLNDLNSKTNGNVSEMASKLRFSKKEIRKIVHG